MTQSSPFPSIRCLTLFTLFYETMVWVLRPHTLLESTHISYVREMNGVMKPQSSRLHCIAGLLPPSLGAGCFLLRSLRNPLLTFQQEARVAFCVTERINLSHLCPLLLQSRSLRWRHRKVSCVRTLNFPCLIWSSKRAMRRELSHRKAAQSECPAGLGEESGSWCRRSHPPSSEPLRPWKSTLLSPPAVTQVHSY